MHNPGEFQADLEKYYRIEFGGEKPNLKRRAKLWATHFGLHCVAVYRLGRFSRALLRRNPLAISLVLLHEVLSYLVRLIHHVDVFSADIGPGFYIGHPGTIYIGKTRVGANFSVTHNVTIGLGAARGSAGVPVLGDDVWVGAGSILYGDISIGNGVTINGGTVLSRSLPDRCLAGGNPGRILLMNYDNASLFGGYYGGPTIDIPPAAPAAANGAKGANVVIAPATVSAAAPAANAPAPLPTVPGAAVPMTAVPVATIPVTTVPEAVVAVAVATPVAAVAAVQIEADQASAPVTVTPVVVTAATVTPVAVAPIAAAKEIPAEAA